MASQSLPYPDRSAAAGAPVHPAHLMILLIVSLGGIVWGALLITGRQGNSLQEYLLLLGFFGLASASFIFVRVHRDPLNLFSLPVFLTVLVFMRFGLLPLNSFLNPQALGPNFLGQYDPLVEALLLVAAGMLAFWLGSACLGRGRRAPSIRPGGGTARVEKRNPVLAIGAGLYGAALATRLYLFHAHLLGYNTQPDAYRVNLASLQVLTAVSSLGLWAMIVFAIERYSHPGDRTRCGLFVLALASECGWGLISGDKHALLENFFLVAVVSSIIQRRIRKGWLLAPFLGLVLFYPLSNSYRALLRRHGGASSVTAATSLGRQALSQSVRRQDGVNGWMQSGWSDTIRRLDLLQSVGLVLSLGPRASQLQGRERWWMVPYYPFVPRFIWTTKPVLGEGGRFSVAIGSPRSTSTAMTYPGDLYARYGWPGILAGMFLLGMAAEWLTAGVSGAPDKRNLFLFASIFLMATDMEIDAFSFWTGLIKNIAILSAVALVIYGPRHAVSSAPIPAAKRRRSQPCES